MKITECGFNNKNIYFATLPDGRLLIANGDTGKVYEVKVVDEVQADFTNDVGKKVYVETQDLKSISIWERTFIDELNMSVRTTNALIRAGLDTVADVIRYFGPTIATYVFLDRKYKHINALGYKSRRELQNRLKELGVI